MNKTKKAVSILLVAAMLIGVICIAPFSAAAVSNTWDPDHDFYNISTEADLFAFRDALNNNQDFDGIEVNLLNNIEISAGTDYVSPNYNQAVFCGTFNGHNYTISNLNMVSSDNESVSLFAKLNNATIKDFTLNDVKIENGLIYNSAFAAVTLNDVEITNCHINGNSLIKGKSDYYNFILCAGFVACAAGSNLKISNCTVADTVRIGDDSTVGYRESGGLVGFISGTSTSVLDSNNRASVNGNYAVGGIVAQIQNQNGNQGSLIIGNCINYGNLVVNPGEGDVGGIIADVSAYSAVYIDGCANHGDITEKGISPYVGSGGIVGEVNGGMCLIQNTYNTGNIVADHAQNLGGIAGHLRTNDASVPTLSFNTNEYLYYPENFNRIINCYNTGNVTNNRVENSAETFTGGICGSVQDSSAYISHTFIENTYNFGEVSGNHNVAAGIAYIDNSSVKNTYISQNEDFIKKYTNGSGQLFESEIGYFDTPETTGKVYPGTINTNGEKTISSTPLTTNLLQTLQSYVDTKNAELETAGNDFRYKSWKMTNPASEDGSKVSTVHPMFGVEVLQTLKFHVNEPGTADKLFRVYNGDASEAEDTTEYSTTNDTVTAFYDIPAFAGDDYVFAGWYYDTDGDKDGDIPFEFDASLPADLTDVYAHWIPVGEVSQDGDDDKVLPDSMNNKYSGFELFGVQIRPEAQFDHNLGEYYYGGLRFVSSVSESLLSDIDALSGETVNGNKVEYGFVTAAKSTIDTVANDSSFNIDKDKYKIQYKGTNVNGVNTTVRERSANNFNYVTNVDCTSQVVGYGSNSKVKFDHKNFGDYRLMTFVVNYTGETAEADKGEDIVARAYLRYYDANGLLRTFYNDYGGTKVYGGCSTSFNTVNALISGDIKTDVKQ